MLPAKKRFKLLLLASFFLSFGIEENYCSESNPVKNGQNINLQAQEVGVRGKVMGSYIGCEGFANIFYWLFDWYQKEPGFYWYKHYRSFGYRTRLLSNRFYFDFYMRTWINIPLVVLVVFNYYSKMDLESRSSGYNNDEELLKAYMDKLSNRIKAFLCFIFVPSVDLNIRLGKKFYLVIGFRDIILVYFKAKEIILDNQIKNIKSNRAS